MEDLSRADSWVRKYKYPLILSFVGGVLMIGGMFSSQLFTHLQPQKKEAFPKEAIVNKADLFIKIDVSGQVNKPGVYSLSQDSRVEDAIKAAGGVTSLVDSNYLTKTINLAQKISDGAKIYIPAKGESSTTAVLGASLSNGQNSVININNADLSSLDSLPGIGQVTGQKIIDNRPYSSIDDLLAKKVVSQSVFTKIKDKISAS